MIKINKKSFDIDNTLNIINMSLAGENNEYIKITVNDGNEHGLVIGDEISFNKYYKESGYDNILTTKTVKVIDIIDNQTFIIDFIPNTKLYVIDENPPQLSERILTLSGYFNILPCDIEKYNKLVNNFNVIFNKGGIDELTVINVYNVDGNANIYGGGSDYNVSELHLNEIYIKLNNEEGSLIDCSITFSCNEFFFIKNNQCIMFSNVKLNKNNVFYNIPVTLASNDDYERLMQEENLTKHFNLNVKPYIIPEIINTEKVKYKPILDDSNYADSLIFNLHFRVRNMENNEWYIEDSEKYWNGIDNLSELNDEPDSLYYLGFTDEDILNQKMKLKKSFLRLSFYDSKDPLTQKLLFYSTIFMDSGSLYGKYLKLLRNARKKGLGTNILEMDCKGENILNSQFVVCDEYNEKKSSEGYNLYLFEDDAPLKNEEKDIYLKVEFNHAGYGRTIPMTLMTNEGLTLQNYFDNLYINVKLSYNNKGYVYFIPEVQNRDNSLIFNLFEPKLEEEKN